MDPIVLMGMIFSLIVLLLLGGFILLFPLSRRLGVLLEEWIRDKKREGPLPSGELKQLSAALAALEERVDRMDQRQQFLEELASPDALPSAEAGETDPRPDPSG